MRPDDTPHRCGDTLTGLRHLVTHLGPLLVNPLPEMWVTKCVPCRNKKSRNCTGPRINIPPENPLAFTPVKVKSGKTVQLDISGVVQCGPDGRLNVADAEHCVHFRLWLLDDGPRKLILRSHVDVANIGQPGPATHLQFGCEEKDKDWSFGAETGSIRWPAPVTDFVLAAELGLYSLWFTEWRRLVQKREFVNIIRASEDTRIARFMDTWKSYISGRDSAGTFLGALCNQTSPNPLRAVPR